MWRSACRLDVEEGLYRIALEALNNALKHAQAQTIKVHLRQHEPPTGAVALEITDDGIGFAPAFISPERGPGIVGDGTRERRSDRRQAKHVRERSWKRNTEVSWLYGEGGDAQ